MGTFGSICRLCCGEENNLIQIFSCYDLRMQLADKIKKYLDVEVLEGDSLPKNVCSGCLVKLKDVEDFVELVKKAQRTLAQLHLQTQEAKQRAEGGSALSGCEDSSNLVTLLLLQDELKRLHNATGLASLSCNAALSASHSNAGSRRRKGQKRPVKAIRKYRAAIPDDVSGAVEQCPQLVKNEPVDQDPVHENLRAVAQEEHDALYNGPSEGAVTQNRDCSMDSVVSSSASSQAFPVSFFDVNAFRETESLRSFKNSNDKREQNNNNDPSDVAPINEACNNDDAQEVVLDCVPEPSKCHIGRCSVCEAPFYALSSLLLHLHMQHSQEPKPQNPLMCLYCNLTYRDLNKLSEHTSLKHSDVAFLQESQSSNSSATDGSPAVRARRKPRNRQSCAECDKTFPSKRGLMLHQKVHSKNQKAAKLFKTRVKQARKKVRASVRCSVCGDAASSFPQLKAHVAAEHPDTNCSTPFMCNLCNKSYSAPASLVQHKAKHGVDAISCPICSKSYHPKYLKKHMIVHQEHRPYKCEECDKTFKDPEGLRHHGLKHRPDEQKYKCSCHVCGHRFMNNGALNVHIKVVHQQVKDFSCQFCDRKFGSKSTAEIHERTHTGEKPFCCELCGWRCNSKGKLKVHMRVHSDVKPYECKSCGKRTRSRNEMRQHELIHTDTRPYPCHFCEKRFRSTSQLKIHVRQHTGERPYQCPHCTRNFCDFANYSKHMHRVHKKEFELTEDKMLYKGVPGKDLASAGKMQGPAHVTPETASGDGPVAEDAKDVNAAVSSKEQVPLALRAMPYKNGNNASGILSNNKNNDSNESRTSTGSQDMYNIPAALQLLRPSNPQQPQQSHLLQQLHLQQHQQQQALSSESSLTATPSNMQSTTLSHHQTSTAPAHAAHQHHHNHLHHHHHHPQQQQQQSLVLQKAHHHPHQSHQQQLQQQQQQQVQQHQQPPLKSHQQQLIEQLLPLNLPPPPQAHQRLPHSLLHSSHSSHHLPLASSSLLSSLSNSVATSTAPGTHHHHHQTQPHQQQSGSSSVYSNSQHPVANMASQLHMQQQQLSHHQVQQQQLLQQQQQQQQQYQNLAVFGGSHLNNLSSSTYDPFRLPL